MKVLNFEKLIKKGFIILNPDDNFKRTACQWTIDCPRLDNDCEKCGWSNQTRKMTHKQASEYWKNKSL